MIEPRYELMIRDVIAETMDHFMDTVSRSVLNSVPVPDVVLEEKFCKNMIECVEDILNEGHQRNLRATIPVTVADSEFLSPKGFKVFKYLNNVLEEILHGRKD